MDEPYEDLVAAIALIDAAIEHLGEDDEETSDLNDIRNRLNHRRVELLGGGLERPYYVSDLGLVP